MNVLYAGGVNNPMDSIEQLSYLIFLRLLFERDEQAAHIEKGYRRIFSGQWTRYAWDNFVTLTGNELFDTLRGAIEKLHELPSLSQTGKMLFRNATLKIYDRPTLRAIVQIITDMDLAPHEGHDLKGDMYEYLLSKLAQSGTNGQFRTPRHIIDLIVALVDPQPGLRICDPACGTAGFLISAYTYILRKHTKPADLVRSIVNGSLLKPKQWEFLESHAFTGFDNDANMVKIAILNLYLHQLERARVEHHNPLTTTQGGQYPGPKYDVILANPPFAGRVQKESILADINLDTREHGVAVPKMVPRPPDRPRPRRGHRAQRRALRLRQGRPQGARAADDHLRPAGRHRAAVRCIQAVLGRRHSRFHLPEGPSDRVRLVLPAHGRRVLPRRQTHAHRGQRHPRHPRQVAGPRGRPQQLPCAGGEDPRERLAAHARPLQALAAGRGEAPRAGGHPGECDPDGDGYRGAGQNAAARTKRMTATRLSLQLADITQSRSDSFVDGPFGSNLKTSDFVSTGLPVVRVQHIGLSVFKGGFDQFVTSSKFDELSRHSARSGDIVFAKMGDPIGRSALILREWIKRSLLRTA
jgi:N-6 DNA methylase